MKVVADTNVVVSALLWRGSLRLILDAASAGAINLFVRPLLLAELQDVLQRPAFARRLQEAAVQPVDLVLGYAALATLFLHTAIPPTIAADPDDDHVLACAVAVQADVIVSGDRHLLALVDFRSIPIVNPAELLSRLGS